MAETGSAGGLATVGDFFLPTFCFFIGRRSGGRGCSVVVVAEGVGDGLRGRGREGVVRGFRAFLVGIVVVVVVNNDDGSSTDRIEYGSISTFTCFVGSVVVSSVSDGTSILSCGAVMGVGCCG